LLGACCQEIVDHGDGEDRDAHARLQCGAGERRHAMREGDVQSRPAGSAPRIPLTTAMPEGDSNPRHAEYDSAALWLYSSV
jgi:hypothetical protein